VAVGLGVVVSSGGDGVFGVGVGEIFFRFDFATGLSLGEGVGDVFFCLGDEVGDGPGVDFVVECFRCFRAGVGVGVALKKFWIFSPNDSSAPLEITPPPNAIAVKRKKPSAAFNSGKLEITSPVLEEPLC
jgi:hypothetical protein